jgi:Family of unknown function (DUF6113)
MTGPSEHGPPAPPPAVPAPGPSAGVHVGGGPPPPPGHAVPPGTPRPAVSHLEAIVTGASYGVLVVLGLVLAVVGGFHATWTTAAGVPVVAIIAVVVNLVVFWVAGWATRSKLGSLLPAVAWLIVASLLSVRRVEGDLIITGSVAGHVFLLGGSVAATVAVVLAPAARLQAVVAGATGAQATQR